VNEKALASWELLRQKKGFLKFVLVRAVKVYRGTGGISLRICLFTTFVSVSAIPSYSLRLLLLSPAMRSNAGMANRQRDVDLRFAQFSARSLFCGWLDGWVVGWLDGWLLYPYLSSAMERDVTI
jgi:hypothetical protein